MKTPEKVKRGLECCFQYKCCIGCPYFNPAEPKTTHCVERMGVEALLCIQQLESIRDKRAEDAGG